MELVGILYHPHKAEARPLAEEVSRWLAERSIESWTAPGHDGSAPLGTMAGRVSESSLIVVLGGDGSTLRAARLAAPHDIPLFGVNLGRVGFLSEASPENWRAKLGQVVAGECWVERRLMLRAVLVRENQSVRDFVALNDVVVGRGTQARVLHLHLHVDGDHVTTYTADALIVATPTGSTAYAMAAGGPLLPPQLFNFLVIPVAPHLSLDRAVILHEEAQVSVEVRMDHEATVTADGQDMVALASGDRVVVARHDDTTCFARVGSPSYFYHRLMERLGFWHTIGS